MKESNLSRYIGYRNRHDPTLTPAFSDEPRFVRCGTFKNKDEYSKRTAPLDSEEDKP